MSLKAKQIIKNFIKITTLSLLFVVGFLVINNYVGAEKGNEVINFKSNEESYKNIKVNTIANVGVAISSNIGIGINKKQKISEENINNKIFKVEDFYNTSDNLKNEIIIKNMLFTKEYFNILQMDFNSVISKSKNREKTLTNLINQLQIRYKNANTNSQTLIKQKELLNNEYNKISTQIETLKKNLENDFTKSESTKVFTHVEDYYILKNKEVSLKTNIIFINEFLKRYNYLNRYNKLLLDTIINNKDIISKNSYVVIPDSGSDLLKSFNIIFSEAEYKTKNQ